VKIAALATRPHRRHSGVSRRGWPTPLAWLVVAALGLTLGGPIARAKAAPKVLRLATLLPRGSSWMQQIQRFAKRVKKQTRGRVLVRCYPGAIMGDERDMLRKMARGRLDGAALSGTGLGQILPASRVLEMPLMFRDASEVVAVRNAIAPELLKALRKRGFELLSWGEIGWVHYFTQRKLRSVADLKRVTFWAWADDPLAHAVTKEFGLKVVKLPIQDVLPSLQTGLVAGAYGTPYTTLALQWHTRLRFYSTQRIAYGIAGLVLLRSSLAGLSTTERNIIRREAKRFGQLHTAQVRRENRAAITQLHRSGLKPVTEDKPLRRALHRLAPRVWASLTGKLFSAALLKRVIAQRDAYRRRTRR
jgi:TRAP-type C4-dicarboxylate transport system substrate-binding protein